MAIQYGSDEWQSDYAAGTHKEAGSTTTVHLFHPRMGIGCTKKAHSERPAVQGSGQGLGGTVVLHVLANPEYGVRYRPLRPARPLARGVPFSAIGPAEVVTTETRHYRSLDRWVQVGKERARRGKRHDAGQAQAQGRPPKIVPRGQGIPAPDRPQRRGGRQVPDRSQPCGNR